MRIITGALSFFEISAGIIERHAARDFAAEAAARVFADQAPCCPGHIHPSRNRWHRLRGALRPSEDMHFAVLPVRHRGARLQRLVADVRRHKGFVQNQRGILKTRIQIAVLPVIGHLAHRQLTSFVVGKILLRPFQFTIVGGGGFGGGAPGAPAGAGA